VSKAVPVRGAALYVVKRVGWMVIVVFCVTIITFLLSRVIPANPAAEAAGVGATPAQIAALAHKMGLDRPLTSQYLGYLTGLFHLDLGQSIRTGDSVRSDLGHYLPATFELVVVSFVVYLVLAVSLGMLSARRPGGIVDAVIRLFSVVSSAAPVFWVALILQLVLYAKLGWVPSGGRLNSSDIPPPTVTGFYTVDSLLDGDVPLFLDALQHLALPVTAIVLSMLGLGVRLIRASLINELGEPYVRTARAKGLRPARVLFGHVLKNALNPFVSMAGIQLGYLFAWIILVEAITQWPGIGLYAYQSFQSLDYNPIMGITLVISVLFVVINFLVDLIYPMLDPRVRHA
jgi:ABC-type dipeptide/oligopeptide/nickel transport system permease component